jgi:hypothetical protein
MPETLSYCKEERLPGLTMRKYLVVLLGTSPVSWEVLITYMRLRANREKRVKHPIELNGTTTDRKKLKVAVRVESAECWSMVCVKVLANSVEAVATTISGSGNGKQRRALEIMHV